MARNIGSLLIEGQKKISLSLLFLLKLTKRTMMVTWEAEESCVLLMLHGSSFAGSLFLVYKFHK
jgi:hypothetical protein